MARFLLGDFYAGDRVVLADGRGAVVVRLEDSDRLRVRVEAGEEAVVKVSEVIAREGQPRG